MTTEPFSWSLRQAIKIFLKTLYGDLYRDRAVRRRLTRQSEITEQTTSVGGGTLTFLESGGGAGEARRIPILFLHGTPGSALCWKEFLSAPGEYKIVAVDRPGFGPAAGRKPDLEEEIGLLGEFLKRIVSENGEAIVAGHSLGAGLAARLAVAHRDKIRGLMLIGGSIDPALERTFKLQRIFAVPPLSRLFTRSIRSSNRELLQYRGFLERLSADLAKISCPVAVVHSRDDRLVPYENVRYAERHFTNAAAFKVISVDSGGHFLNHTRPDTIRDALRNHIVGA